MDFYFENCKKLTEILFDNKYLDDYFVRKQEIARKLYDRYATAEKEFFYHNWKLVFSVAKKYIGRGLALKELISAGNEGLLKAFEKFDPNKKCRFSTYAPWWIRQHILKELAEMTQPISVNSNMSTSLNRARKLRNKLIQEQERNLTLEETINGMRVSKKTKKSMLKANQTMRKTVSFDAKANNSDDEDSRISDLIPSNTELPEDYVDKGFAIEKLKKLVENLNERDKLLMTLRYGLDGQPPRTLKTTSKAVKMCRESVRQIENKILENFREKFY